MSSIADAPTQEVADSHITDTVFIKFYQYVGTPGSMARYIDEMTTELARRMPNAHFVFWTGVRPVNAQVTDGYVDCSYRGTSRVVKMFHMAGLELRIMRAIRKEVAKGRRVALFETQWLASPFWGGLTLTSVNDMIPAQSQGPKGWYYRRVVPWLLGRKHTCISISQFTQGILRSIGIQSEVVYTWLSPRLVKHIGERQKIHSGSPYLFIGTSAPHKNLECIFSAYLATELRRPLVCVVPAWDKPHLEERVVSIGLSAKVSFESDLDDEQMAALYKSAMALISPSLLEGFGMPLIEAMAFGCPVICSDIPIYREVAGDAAIFFDVESADSLLAALVKRENEDTWCDYQQRGRERVEIFSWESAVEGYRKRLQQILDSQTIGKNKI